MTTRSHVLPRTLLIVAALSLGAHGGPPRQGLTAPKREPRPALRPAEPTTPQGKPGDPKELEDPGSPANPAEKPELPPAPASGPGESGELTPAPVGRPGEIPEEGSPGSIHLDGYPDSPDAIQPLPPTPIPDSPPPHEGAPFLLPYRIQPPDVIHIAILQAAPGRQLDGDRLIRPDGLISLDFYGDLAVADLTTRQVKERVILHLRRHLTDTVLGLVKMDEETGEPVRDAHGKFVGIPLADSDCVYVDVAQYNSGIYYAQGDVALPGRFPLTGHEFVLDALNYAGGLLPTAEEADIRLVRPARGTAPGRVYRVDLAAIRDRGESATNYQLFSGDRLVVGRNPVSRISGQLNRTSEPLVVLANDIRTFALTMKAVNEASLPPITPAQRDEFVRRWTEFLRAEAEHPGGPVLDERAWKEFLERFTVPPAAATPRPSAP